MSLISLETDCDKEVSPGVDTQTYWVYEKEIDTMPALKTSTGAGDKMVYDGSIVLLPGAEWRAVRLHTKTGEVENNKVGENGIGGWTNKMVGQIAGNAPAQAQFAKCATSACGVVILVKQNDGNMRVIGKKGAPAIVQNWDEKTGKTSTDFAGHTFLFQADNNAPAYFYEGTITPIMPV